MDAFSSKIVYVPFEQKTKGKDGEDKTKRRFSRTGCRVQLGGGEWWFYKYRTMYRCSDGTERTKREATEWCSRGPERTMTPVDRSTWSRHLPGAVKTYRSGTPIIGKDGQPEREPETKQGPYAGDDGLRAAFGHVKRPYPLVDLLLSARQQAEAEDAEKQAARMAG